MDRRTSLIIIMYLLVMIAVPLVVFAQSSILSVKVELNNDNETLHVLFHVEDIYVGSGGNVTLPAGTVYADNGTWFFAGGNVTGPVTIHYVKDAGSDALLAEARYGGYTCYGECYTIPAEDKQVIAWTEINTTELAVHGLTPGTLVSFPQNQEYHNTTGNSITITTGKGTYRLLYYYTENKLYVLAERSPEEFQDVETMLQPNRVIDYYRTLWKDWAFIVPYLLPASIFIARRSVALFSASMVVLGSAQIVVFPQEWRGLGVLSIALGLSVLIFTLIRERERW